MVEAAGNDRTWNIQRALYLTCIDIKSLILDLILALVLQQLVLFHLVTVVELSMAILLHFTPG